MLGTMQRAKTFRRFVYELPTTGSERGFGDFQLSKQVQVACLPDQLAESGVVYALAGRGGEHGGA